MKKLTKYLVTIKGNINFQENINASNEGEAGYMSYVKLRKKIDQDFDKFFTITETEIKEDEK